MLAADYGSAVIFMKNAAIRHKEAGKGFISELLVETREVMYHYYTSLDYSDLSKEKQLNKTNEEGRNGVHFQAFLEVWFKVPDQFL